MSDTILALIAVLFGWILGETTSLLKKRWSIRNLKKSLFLEIEDALSWLKRNQITLEYVIQLAVLKEFIDVGPVKVPTHIYDKHFPEISPHLTKSERVSYNSIYNLIHRSYEDMSRLIDLIRADPGDDEKRRELTGILEAIYHNTSMAIYQIQYHLANKENLDINKVTGEHAKQIDDGITRRLHEICSEAIRIGIEEVKRRNYER
jgi:hypothetical protein